MSLRQPARVKQTSTTTGAGTLTLIAAASNFQGFNAMFGAGPVKVMYAIAGTSYYEVGVGTWTTAGPNTLSRDTILASSAGGAAVSLPAGTHDVFAWAPSMWPVDARTGSPALTLADLFGLILYTGTGGTLSLPALATLPGGIAFPVINLGSGALLVDPNSTETINGVTTLALGVGQGGWIFNRDTATAQWTALLGVTANPAALDVAQTFTAAQAITVAGLTTLTETSTDAGATEGPIEDLFRDSASPAASDLIAALYFSGRSSTAVKRQYAKIIAQILDATNASEDAVVLLQTIVAGALATRATLGAGLLMAGATGGDPGAGQVNATAYKVNGTAIPFTKEFVSSAQTITNGGSLALPHSLGVQPKLYVVEFTCITGEAGYTAGDEVCSEAFASNAAVDNGLLAVVPDATNLNVRFNNVGLTVINKTTGVSTAVTNGNWNVVFKAWA